MFTILIMWAAGGLLKVGAQQYYIDEGDGIRPVSTGKPEDVQPDYWTIRLYPKGTATGGRGSWGAINGKSANEVMEELRESQSVEEAWQREFGRSQPYLTYFNFTGPIAVFHKKKTNLQIAADAWKKLNEVHSTIKKIRDILRTEPKTPNRFANVGKTLEEYVYNFEDIHKKVRELENELNNEYSNINQISAGLSVAGQQLDSLAREIKRPLGTGDVQATLSWTGKADLDLHVIDPKNEEIWYDHKSSISGGVLDVDDTRGPGPENIFWPKGAAPSGDTDNQKWQQFDERTKKFETRTDTFPSAPAVYEFNPNTKKLEKKP